MSLWLTSNIEKPLLKWLFYSKTHIVKVIEKDIKTTLISMKHTLKYNFISNNFSTLQLLNSDKW